VRKSESRPEEARTPPQRRHPMLDIYKITEFLSDSLKMKEPEPKDLHVLRG
jgi:hypothetical protein